MGIRFAGARWVKELAQHIIPDLSTGRGKVELAARFVPDFLFPAINALNMPEGTSAGERAGVYGELLAGNLGASFLGQGLGYAGGKAYLRGRKQLPGSEAYREILGHSINAGDIAGQLASSFAPTPFMNSVYERNAQRLAEQQQGIDPAQLAEEYQQQKEQDKQLTDMFALAAFAAQPYRGYSNAYGMPGTVV